MSECPETRLRALWLEQPIERVTLDVEAIRRNVNLFQRRIRFRNVLEYGAAALVLVVFTWRMLANLNEFWLVTGCLLVDFATLWIVLHLRRHGQASTPPVDVSTRAFLTYTVDELTRQWRLLKGIFWWYIAPFLPGIIVLNFIHERPFEVRDAVSNVIMALIVVGIYALNQATAKNLLSKIVETKALLRQLDEDCESQREQSI